MTLNGQSMNNLIYFHLEKLKHFSRATKLVEETHRLRNIDCCILWQNLNQQSTFPYLI